MREFYQCDFDFAGEFDVMIPDVEVLSITAEVFEALDLDVTIKINHRHILDGIFDAVGVPDNLIRPITLCIAGIGRLLTAALFSLTSRFSSSTPGNVEVLHVCLPELPNASISRLQYYLRENAARDCLSQAGWPR